MSLLPRPSRRYWLSAAAAGLAGLFGLVRAEAGDAPFAPSAPQLLSATIDAVRDPDTGDPATDAPGALSARRDGQGTVLIDAPGPVLDSPDAAQIGAVSVTDRTLHITVVHTQQRATGAILRRNYLWRPVVRLAVAIPDGNGSVVVTWSARESLLPGGRSVRPDVVREIALGT